MQRVDRVALITGGSAGIGAACVRRFANAGWNVAVLDLANSGLDRIARPNILTIAGDVTSAEARSRAVDRTIARYKRIDVLINNAGVGLYAPPSVVSVDLMPHLFAVNVFAPLALAQLIIPIMRRQGSGTVVNIGSVVGQVSLPWAVAYSASKFALHAIDDSLRRELRRERIHVMKVCAGIVDTGFRDHVLAGRAPAAVKGIRWTVSPDTVAARIFRGVECGCRTVYVPWIARFFMLLESISPRMMDWYLARFQSTSTDITESFDDTLPRRIEESPAKVGQTAAP